MADNHFSGAKSSPCMGYLYHKWSYKPYPLHFQLAKTRIQMRQHKVRTLTYLYSMRALEVFMTQWPARATTGAALHPSAVSCKPVDHTTGHRIPLLEVSITLNLSYSVRAKCGWLSASQNLFSRTLNVFTCIVHNASFIDSGTILFILKTTSRNILKGHVLANKYPHKA